MSFDEFWERRKKLLDYIVKEIPEWPDFNSVERQEALYRLIIEKTELIE